MQTLNDSMQESEDAKDVEESPVSSKKESGSFIRARRVHNDLQIHPNDCLCGYCIRYFPKPQEESGPVNCVYCAQDETIVEKDKPGKLDRLKKWWKQIHCEHVWKKTTVWEWDERNKSRYPTERVAVCISCGVSRVLANWDKLAVKSREAAHG